MFDTVADQAFKLWGLHGTSLIVTLLLISFVCQTVGKIIPEDATGWKGVVRKVCKVVGIYVSNRITSGVSTADVARATLSTGAVPVGAAQNPPAETPASPPPPPPTADEPLELTAEDRLVIPAFPGYERPRDSEGHYLPLEGDK